MIEPYSLDLRERAVALIDEGASRLEVAEMLGVSDSWVRKMRLRRDALGHLMPGSPPGKERKLTEAHEEDLCLLVFNKLDATSEELVELAAKAPEGAREHLDHVASPHRAGADAQRVFTPPKPSDPRSSKNATGSCVEASSDGPRA